MKKFMTMALALSMAASLCVPAFALGANDVKSFTDSYKEERDVKVVVSGVTASGDKVYGTTIAWEDPTFTYEAANGSATKWDPETHTYKAGSGTIVGAFDKDKMNVVVYNHSNAPIKATCFVGKDVASATTAEFAITGYDVKFTVTNPDGNAATLAAAQPNSALDSVKTTFNMAMSGADMNKYAQNMIAGKRTADTVGNIVVNITPAA